MTETNKDPVTRLENVYSKLLYNENNCSETCELLNKLINKLGIINDQPQLQAEPGGLKDETKRELGLLEKFEIVSGVLSLTTDEIRKQVILLIENL